MSVLESTGAAMPGIGFVLGGLIAATSTPRTTFLVAGLGVFAILVLVIPLLGPNWIEREAGGPSYVGAWDLDGGEDVVLEFVPLGRRGRPVHSKLEVSP
jgi:4-amino-4-deoxy-L-arabinose transferase-like glycosyltransferase